VTGERPFQKCKTPVSILAGMLNKNTPLADLTSKS